MGMLLELKFFIIGGIWYLVVCLLGMLQGEVKVLGIVGVNNICNVNNNYQEDNF